jgi:hypothetical protein
MYARVSIARSQLGKADEVIRIHRDSVVPAAKQQKGFKGLYLLTDRKTGKGGRGQRLLPAAGRQVQGSLQRTARAGGL